MFSVHSASISGSANKRGSRLSLRKNSVIGSISTSVVAAAGAGAGVEMGDDGGIGVPQFVPQSSNTNNNNKNNNSKNASLKLSTGMVRLRHVLACFDTYSLFIAHLIHEFSIEVCELKPM